MSRQAPLTSEIAILQNQSLTTVVQRELETQIMAGALLPGDKLNEIDIAGRLNVSRGPVREAFRALEQAGLVRTEKNRGVFVRAMSLEEADEVYALRGVLDEHVGRELAARITPEGLRELRTLIEALADASTTQHAEAYARLNLEFHDRMVSLVRNRKLLDTYRGLVKELALFRREALTSGPAAMPASIREHRDIVSAIAARDADLAGRLMREHAERGRARVHAAVEGEPPLAS